MKSWWVVSLLHDDGHEWGIFVKCRKRRVAVRMAMGAAHQDAPGEPMKYRLMGIRRQGG